MHRRLTRRQPDGPECWIGTGPDSSLAETREAYVHYRQNDKIELLRHAATGLAIIIVCVWSKLNVAMSPSGLPRF